MQMAMWLRYIKVKERASSVIQTAIMETELKFTGTRSGVGTELVHGAKDKSNSEQIAHHRGIAKTKFSWNLQCKLRGKIARVLEKVELSLIFVLQNH